MRDVTALRGATNRAATMAAFGWENRDKPCFALQNAADESVKLYVYDVIGGWESDTEEFVKAVHGITAKTIQLHVNSPGGFVYDAVAMHEALVSHPAKVTTKIDGLAASAASFLALAGDEVEISPGGRMMIHDAQGVGIGSPAEMREYADLLDAVSDDISGYYAARAGGKPGDWRAAMTATTWYSSQQAVDAGLVDRVSGTESDTGKTKNYGASNRSRLIKARAAATLGGVK
jgi:ATP-dependent protease ClpP protease subunit